ncbi:hypothetical protein D9M71_286760 [compost metagenome]
MRLASSQATLHFFWRQQQGATIVTRGLATRRLLGAHLVKFFGRAKAREGMPQVYQLLGVLLIDIAPLALPVRAMGSTDIRAFAPFDTQPAQGVEYLLLRFPGRAQLIGIFDAQDELAAVLLGKAIVEQGDVSRADMGVPGGRWRDTSANGGH